MPGWYRSGDTDRFPMPPSPTDSRQPNRGWQLQTQRISGFRASGGRSGGDGGDGGDQAVSQAAQKAGPIELRASIVLAVAAYALALAAGELLEVRASALDGIPLFLGPAAFLHTYNRLVFPRAARLTQAIEAASVMIVLGLSLACLSYIGAMADLPLRDHAMIAVDRHLGFDWLSVMAGLDRWPGVLMLLDGAYATFTSQLIATVLVLIVARRSGELDRFLVTFVCATLIAEVTSTLVPTVGPMTALAGNTEFAHLATLGRATGETVLALRRGTLTVIDLDAINGIISFPSLHAAVAVIVPFTLRWNKPLFWAFVVLDGVMFVSAVPSGNHYVTDVAAGVMVAALAIVCGRRVQQSLERRIGAGIANFQSALQPRLPRVKLPSPQLCSTYALWSLQNRHRTAARATRWIRTGRRPETQRKGATCTSSEFSS
jgi:membrane-associated phospholipid phosphatase